VFFANLSVLEFSALLAAGAGALLALYFLIRTRLRRKVSTLRFWRQAERLEQQAHRRRIDQPWSLLLQLLALIALLLAIAQPRFGRPGVGRDHILLLDTSAWTAARAPGERPSLVEAKRLALDWLRRLPSDDRVMLVRAEAVNTPLTRFESNRGAVEAAIRAAVPSLTALDLDNAFRFSSQALRMEGRQAGEIVYIGPARVAPSDTPPAPPSNLRYLETRVDSADAGFTRASLRRSPADPELWQAFVSVRNHGSTPRAVRMIAGIGGALVNVQNVSLPPAGETEARFEFRTAGGGMFEARLESPDSVAADDRVTLEAPRLERLRVAVYSARPEPLRQLLAADPRIQATFAAPSAYTPKPDADLVITDSFRPSAEPETDWLNMNPGTGRGIANPLVTRWSPTHPVGAGLHTRDLKLGPSNILPARPGDEAVAEALEGPLILARTEPNGRKRVTIGFDLGEAPLRFELATPLLFANICRWIAPKVFVNEEILAVNPGAVTADLAETPDPGRIRVIDAAGRDMPFTLDGRTLRFFSAEPTIVRVIAPSAERVFSLSLPALAAARWTPPASVVRGLGPKVAGAGAPRELWQWFALLGVFFFGLEWWLFGRRGHTSSRTLAWAVKGAAAAAVLIGLFQPDFSVRETKLAVGVLVDTSASVPAQDLAQASAFAAAVENARGRNLLRVLPFARNTRSLDPLEFASGLRLRPTAGEAGRATDLEAALREAATALPAGLVPRLVLVSDGRETHGSVTRSAWQARQLGIPIDTVVLPGRPEPRLRLSSASLPSEAFTGEKFPIDLRVESPSASPGTLEISAEGRSLGSSAVSLEPGANRLHVTASLATPGAIDLVVAVRTPSLGDLRFEQAISLRRPRLLYLSMDARGMESHIISTLQAAQVDVVSNVEFARARFDDYQIVLLNNWDLESMPSMRKFELERFVQQGGGLLIVGGERNIWVDKKGAPPDALERTLPAVVAPPRSPEGATVVLIVDKSSSMEGRKIELARLAAIGVVENLRPIDQVGVLIFDNSHQWAVPIRRAEDRSMIKRLVAGITPDGGTQIAPALAESYKRILPATGAYKHIVLLTDGISEEGDSANVAKEAAANRVTISTVGLGQDVNKAFLEKVSSLARGKSYFLTDPSGLEQILLKDVMEHTGSTTVERSFHPKVLRQAEIFEKLDIEKAPALKGYVRFQAKPTAETLLSIASQAAGEKDDPLLTRWQYGLGRAAVFTSDAKSRWAEAWVSWAGFDKFWANLTRDLLPHAQAAQATLDHDSANGLLIAEYRLAPGVPAPAQPPKLYLLGPDNLRAPLVAEKAGDRLWRARFPIANRTGLFRVRTLEDSRAFPEVGLYLPEPEMASYGNNAALLRQLAAYTGGRLNPAPREVFNSGGRFIPSVLRLWPGLLALGLLLNLAEVAWRRLRGAGILRPSTTALPQAA
jgi:uncharacterized membrane protein